MKTFRRVSILMWCIACALPRFTFAWDSAGPLFVEKSVVATVLGQTNTPATPAEPLAPSVPKDSEPDHGLAAANRIKTLIRDHQMDQALAAARLETDNHPDVALAWYSLGDVLMQIKRPQEAISPLQKSVALLPRNGPALFDLGTCLAQTGQFDQAIDILSRAIDRMPEFLPAWVMLYKSYGGKHDIVGAEAKFQGYVNANPKSACAWFMLGQLQSFEQLPTSALESLQKAVDLKPDFPEALRSLGLAYAHSHQLGKAIDCFARSAAVRPDAEVVNNLGFAYLSLGQTDKAIEAFKQALQLDPKYEKSLYNLTNAYAKEQQWALARQTCQALAQINPSGANELSRNFPPADATPALTPVTTPAPAQTAAEVPDTNSPPVSTNQSALPVAATTPAQTGSTNAAPTLPADTASTSTPSVSAVSAPSLVSTTPTPSGSAPAQPSAPIGTPVSGQPAASSSVPSAAESSAPSTPAAPASALTPAPAVAPAVSPTQLTTQTPPIPGAVTAAAPASVPAAKGGSVGYDVAPQAAWVKPLDPDAIPTPTTTDVAGGIDYLLVDKQQLVDPPASFFHYTLRMVNEEGLQTGSDIRAGFDPNYQTLTLHWLKVKRDGVWQDRLAAEDFQVLRREENLDSQMLDGRYSVVCHLRDVRVGDLVDFAYTVKGANPVFGGKYLDSFLTSFLWPVHLFSNQLTTPPNRMVFLKGFAGAPEPTRTPQPDQSELISWTEKEMPATPLEARTSEWYDIFGWVQLSEFNSWTDVVDWGLKTFSLDDPLSPDLQSKIAEIGNAHRTPEARALAVIDFVQNDVRYLGIEMGANSYRPTPASQVFEHRFGDCKDKTQLCVVMLRALGIEAYPALVSASHGDQTRQLLPSPLAFDHAIVQLTVDNSPYWIDVTRTDQRGQLRNFYVNDFKYALLLKAGTTALVPTAVSRASLPHIQVDESFAVKSMTDPVRLLVHTVFTGGAAESVRSSFKSSSREELQKAYLSYYSRNYAQIKVEQPLRSQDFPDDNRFEVWQDYSISNLWSRDSATTPYKASFEPYSIAEAIGNTTAAPRTTPYRLDYPADISENMEIQLFHKWRIDTTPTEIETLNFKFTEIPWLDENTVHFKYHYQTLAADVLPTAIGNYNQEIKRIQEHLECSLTYFPGVQPDAERTFQPNWMGLTIVGLVFGFCAAAAVGIYFIEPSDGEWDIPFGAERYEGIGGWLIPVCIGIALGIFVDGKTALIDLGMIFDLPKWNLLTQPGGDRYDAYWAPTLLFEGISCVVLLVLLTLAVVLMIQKKFTFPGVMIAVLVLNFIYHSVDHALAAQIASLAQYDRGNFPQEMFHLVVGCAIWIPYFLVSKRVKATFRN